MPRPRIRDAFLARRSTRAGRRKTSRAPSRDGDQGRGRDRHVSRRWAGDYVIGRSRTRAVAQASLSGPDLLAGEFERSLGLATSARSLVVIAGARKTGLRGRHEPPTATT